MCPLLYITKPGIQQQFRGQLPKTPATEENYPAWGLQHDDLSQGEWSIVPADDGFAFVAQAVTDKDTYFAYELVW